MKATVSRKNGLDASIYGKVYGLEDRYKKILGAAVLEYVKAFPLEETWVRKVTGKPSLILRTDFAVDEDKKTIRIVHIDPNPRGIGMARFVGNRCFNERFREVQATWPAYQVVISGQEPSYHEDYLWAGNKLINRQEWEGGLVMVRSGPEKASFPDLEFYSITGFDPENTLRWSENQGLLLQVKKPEQLPIHETFFIKPTPCSPWSDFKVFDPLNPDGSIRLKDIKLMIEKYGKVYCQPYSFPMASENGQYARRVCRVFHGLNMHTQCYECLYGYWSAFTDIRKFELDTGLVGAIL